MSATGSGGVASVIGGVSLVLYGMISAVGIRNLIENRVDFTISRNILIAAVILVLSIGIAYSTAGAIVIPAGDITISLSGLAIGSLAGILLNIILPGEDAVAADNMPLEGPHPYDPEQDPFAK